MKICIVIPVQHGSQRGNEITALRWKSMLSDLSHDVSIRTVNECVEAVDCLIALNAIKSNSAILQYRKRFPSLPIVVCLTGTDLHGSFEDYQEVSPRSSLPKNAGAINNETNAVSLRDMAIASLREANRIILLEPMGKRKLPLEFHSKCEVIYQSAEKCQSTGGIQQDRLDNDFIISQIGHLRKQKNPMLAPQAVRQLPVTSRIKLIHVGEILEDDFRSAVNIECHENTRYRFIGKVDHQAAQQILVGSDLTLLTSCHEGAPSIVSEAIVNEVPLLATRIDATLGMLGPDYSGFFEVGDANALVSLMIRAELEPAFLEQLREELSKRRNFFTPETELKCLKSLVDSLI